MSEVEFAPHEVVVLEQWKVVDRWWTDQPIEMHYAAVMFGGGDPVTMRLAWNDDVWRVMQAP